MSAFKVVWNLRRFLRFAFIAYFWFVAIVVVVTIAAFEGLFEVWVGRPLRLALRATVIAAYAFSALWFVERAVSWLIGLGSPPEQSIQYECGRDFAIFMAFVAAIASLVFRI